MIIDANAITLLLNIILFFTKANKKFFVR